MISRNMAYRETLYRSMKCGAIAFARSYCVPTVAALSLLPAAAGPRARPSLHSMEGLFLLQSSYDHFETSVLNVSFASAPVAHACFFNSVIVLKTFNVSNSKPPLWPLIAAAVAA